MTFRRLFIVVFIVFYYVGCKTMPPASDVQSAPDPDYIDIDLSAHQAFDYCGGTLAAAGRSGLIWFYRDLDQLQDGYYTGFPLVVRPDRNAGSILDLRFSPSCNYVWVRTPREVFVMPFDKTYYSSEKDEETLLLGGKRIPTALAFDHQNDLLFFTTQEEPFLNIVDPGAYFGTDQTRTKVMGEPFFQKRPEEIFRFRGRMIRDLHFSPFFDARGTAGSDLIVRTDQALYYLERDRPHSIFLKPKRLQDGKNFHQILAPTVSVVGFVDPELYLLKDTWQNRAQGSAGNGIQLYLSRYIKRDFRAATFPKWTDQGEVSVPPVKLDFEPYLPLQVSFQEKRPYLYAAYFDKSESRHLLKRYQIHVDPNTTLPKQASRIQAGKDRLKLVLEKTYDLQQKVDAFFPTVHGHVFVIYDEMKNIRRL